MIIYIDVIFAVNFIMDITILWITGIVLHEIIKPLRLIAGAFAGALMYIFTLFKPYCNIYIQLLVILLSITISVLIAYSPDKSMKLLKQVLTAFLISFLIAGTIFALLNLKCIAKNMSLSDLTENFSYRLLFISTAVIYVVLKYGLFGRIFTTQRQLYNIEIVINDKTIKVTALADSGNSLRDNLFDREIIVVEKRLIENTLDLSKGFRLVPYKSLGNKSGLIPVFKTEYVICEGKKKTDVLIAAYDGIFSKDFNALVNYDFLK